MRKILYILLFFGLAVNAQNISPYDLCQDGNPIGGGAGYDAILSTGTHIVSTNLSASAFKTLIEARTSGDIVFINNGVIIDLTSLSSTIEIAAGVTIASDRGTNIGALIKSDDVRYNSSGDESPVFYTSGTGVRFTGIRFQGPYGENGVYDPSQVLTRIKWGISSHWSNTEIDNCELYNWPAGATVFGKQGTAGFYAPVHQAHSTGQLVHHNYIHNNRQNSLGYGVTVDRSDVTIYANIFQDDRHDIAGGGDSSPNYSAYEAYCNTILGNNISHNFDMHGEAADENCTNCIGGKFVSIHHNDFQDDSSNRGTNNYEHIRVRGIPEDNATVTYNKFPFGTKSFFGDTWIDESGLDSNGDVVAFQQRNIEPKSNKPLSIVWNNNTYDGNDPEPGGGIPVNNIIWNNNDQTIDFGEFLNLGYVFDPLIPDNTGFSLLSANSSVVNNVGQVVGVGSTKLTITASDQTNNANDIMNIGIRALNARRPNLSSSFKIKGFKLYMKN